VIKKEKILIIALPGIGDALLATPMIELLRKAKPDSEIHALVMFKATREMFEGDPYVDTVHYYDFVNGGKVGALKTALGLRFQKFDVSINIYPQNRSEYNLIALLIGAKKRLGVLYKRFGRKNLNWLNTHAIVEDDNLHCVEENVKLLSLLGIHHELKEESLPKLRLTLSEEHEKNAATWMESHNLSQAKPLIGFHAGTALFKNHINRRWAPEKFAQLAVRLDKELGAKVLLFGGPDDLSANEVIEREAAGSIIPVRTSNILDSVAVMKGLSLFVSNDSSLMHIAGGLGLPTVAIFGPTNETYVHPWKTEYEIVETGIECRPCFIYSPRPLTCFRTNPEEHFICVRNIEVDQVFEAVSRIIQTEKHRLKVIH